ncbi:MAG TPA: F0F1 ATP synthase subunit delta [Burkholderiales bacterium]|nr:F0F1 ATP synthase subunit delta [Burkholderiales bacterium]
MAEIATLARPYAEAVYKQALDAGRLDEWSTALGALSAAASTPELLEVLGDPRLTDAQLLELMQGAATGPIAGEVRNLVQLLVDNKRLELLPQIRQLYEALKHEHEGVVDAHIVSAFPLDEAQLRNLVNDLEARFKLKVNAEVVVDESLIGGATIQVGDAVIDASVRGKLAVMSAELARI